MWQRVQQIRQRRQRAHQTLQQHVHLARNFARSMLPNVQGLAALPHQARVVIACVLAAALFATTLLVAAPGVASATSGGTSAGDNTVNARQTADNSFLYDTSIYELSEADASYQGDTVQVVGEVVGDSFRAEEDPGKAWITLEGVEDDGRSASISVLVDESVLGLIDTYGAYNRTGTMLQVRGTFYLACPAHEGIIDIHADHVAVVSSGSVTHDQFLFKNFVPGLVLLGIGLALAGVYYFLRERER